MSPLFDKYRNKPIKYLRVVYHETAHPFKLERIGIPQDAATMWDTNLDFEATLEFLASGEYIFTSSYYGMYWGTLLNRKVIVQGDHSSSFKYFKWPAVKSTRDVVQDLWNGVAYEHALEEAREATMSFWEDVKKVLIQGLQ